MQSNKRLSGQAKLSSTRSLKSKSSLKTGAPSLAKGAKKSPAKPKLKSISQLKKLADAAHSKATRYRFAEQRGGEWVAQCVTCSVPEWKPIKTLQCGHFMSRQHNSVRYSEENTAPQCYGCNVMQQGKQYEFGLWIDAMYGEGTARRLHQEAKQPHQFSREELLDIIADALTEVAYYEAQ